MSFKDHYKTLRISPKASLHEIKKAYRTLAHQYHPDKAHSTTGDAALFHQVHEAYKILSNSRQRAAYDQERWLNGKSQVNDGTIISAIWMTERATALSHYIVQTGHARVHQEPLADYINALLSTEHITILQKEGTPEQIQHIARQLYPVVALLHFRFCNTICRQVISMLPPDSDALARQYTLLWKEKQRNALWERYMPFVIIAVAMLLVVIMMALL